MIRTTWDYWDRLAQFLAWARSVPQLVNSADVVAWNTDKIYLRRLQAAGIAVVPTVWVAPGEDFVTPNHPFVVKPTVSAGCTGPQRRSWCSRTSTRPKAPATPRCWPLVGSSRTARASLRVVDVASEELLYARVDLLSRPLVTSSR